MASKTNDAAPAAAMALPKSWPAWRTRIYRAFAAGWAVTVTGSFIESFYGLFSFARHHGRGFWLALLAPTMVDTFILGGEMLILLAVMQRWDWRARWIGYAFTWLGLALSVAGNAGQAGWRIPVVTMVSYALAPVAMTGMTAMGLVIVKRHFHPRRKRPAAWWRRDAAQQHAPEPAQVPVPPRERPPRPPARGATLPAELAAQAEADARRHWPGHIAAGTAPGVREVRGVLKCGQARAERVIAAIDQLKARGA